MKQETELYLQQDGFYAGRMLKSGAMSKGSHRITEEEIMTMFAAIMRTYAAKKGDNTLIIEGDDGRTVVATIS